MDMYFELFTNVIIGMIVAPVLLSIAAGVLFVYGYGIWWVGVWLYSLAM